VSGRPEASSGLGAGPRAARGILTCFSVGGTVLHPTIRACYYTRCRRRPGSPGRGPGRGLVPPSAGWFPPHRLKACWPCARRSGTGEPRPSRPELVRLFGGPLAYLAVRRLVPRMRFELIRPCGQRSLSPPRLPVSPPRRGVAGGIVTPASSAGVALAELEATIGFKPMNRGLAGRAMASAGVCWRRIHARTGHPFESRDRRRAPTIAASGPRSPVQGRQSGPRLLWRVADCEHGAFRLVRIQNSLTSKGSDDDPRPPRGISLIANRLLRVL
jgi:hypothetical protein